MKVFLATLVLAFLMIACGSEDQNARLEIRLTDAPGSYEAVNIDIRGIEIHSEEGNATTGWRSLNVQQGIYDLLQLTNGLDTLLSVTELPPGKISQVRLILGDSNSIQVNGDDYELASPGSQHSGLKLNLHTELTGGITYKILLDFDAARSIVKKGNGSYLLKPVIRCITEAQSGAIKGVVEPAESAPVVYAIAAGDTIATTFADENGRFLLKGVPAGSYTVGIDPMEGFESFQQADVNVETGVVTDLGSIALQ